MPPSNKVNVPDTVEFSVETERGNASIVDMVDAAIGALTLPTVVATEEQQLIVGMIAQILPHLRQARKFATEGFPANPKGQF